MKEELSLQNTLKKGTYTLVVLALLQKKRMYGYELVQTMRHVGEGQFAVQEGTLYPILYRLIEMEMVTDERVLVGKRMTRVYYTITPKGEAYLKKIRGEYDAINAAVMALLNYEPPQD